MNVASTIGIYLIGVPLVLVCWVIGRWSLLTNQAIDGKIRV